MAYAVKGRLFVRYGRRGGFAFVELVLVLLLLGILAALAAPGMSGLADHYTARRALDRLAADIFSARMNAVRDGRRSQIRYDQDDGCIVRYELGWQGDPDNDSDPPPLRVVDLHDAHRGLCLSAGSTQSITFDSRGLATAGRTFTARRGQAELQVSVSRIGRVVRRY